MKTIPSEYGFATLIDDRPERPDPTPEQREAARRADRIGEAELLRARKWTTDDLRDATARFGFPAGRVSWSSGFSFFGPKATTTWSRAAIKTWDEGIRALVGGRK